jgi:hypothetical protein
MNIAPQVAALSGITGLIEASSAEPASEDPKEIQPAIRQESTDASSSSSQDAILT